MNNRYTPKSIVENYKNQVFNIPLYQRLFEWGEAQIERLMEDLYQAYDKAPKDPYYIGMLTAMPRNSILDLVDGQQRFTVLMLLGITFGWDAFLKVQNNPRLRFAARPSDERYLKHKLTIETLNKDDEQVVINEKMEFGLNYIRGFLNDKRKINDSFDETKFGLFIYNNLTFFISKLEESYTMTELNTYFERMNTTGKALEQHEILKVSLLNKLENLSKRETYAKLWNACSMMDRMLYLPSSNTNEQTGDEDDNTYENCRHNYETAINALLSNNTEKLDVIAYEVYKKGDDSDDNKTIGEIQITGEPEKNPNNTKNIRREVYAIPTFPEFLLQVLFITLGYADSIESAESINDINDINITNFFNVHKLNDTFKDCLFKKSPNDCMVKKFLNNMVLYRLILDYFMVRLSDNDDDPYPFTLYKDNELKKKKEIIQYETMLYAASSPMTYYYWIAPFLVWIGKQIEKEETLYINQNEILKTLETLDNKWHPNPFDNKTEEEVASDLKYGNIDRYYFWRIDYYLWKNRDILFNVNENEKENKLASSYIFRRNRSIEHIAPQHFGDDKTRFHWDMLKPEEAALKDCIGNLCMISSGQNSSLKDSAFEEKRGHIESFLNDSIKGYVESLKMLYVYSRYKEWTLDNIVAHEKESIKWLRESYNQGLTVTP